MAAIMRPAGAPGGLRLDAMTPAAALRSAAGGCLMGVQIAVRSTSSNRRTTAARGRSRSTRRSRRHTSKGIGSPADRKPRSRWPSAWHIGAMPVFWLCVPDPATRGYVERNSIALTSQLAAGQDPPSPAVTVASGRSADRSRATAMGRRPSFGDRVAFQDVSSRSVTRRCSASSARTARGRRPWCARRRGIDSAAC